ncbi:MAG: hypothetical protein ACUVTZ_03125 [Armatimonadota bacterium]
MVFTFGPYVEKCFRRSLGHRAAAVATAGVGAVVFGFLYLLSLHGIVRMFSEQTCLISCISLGLAAVLLGVDTWLSLLAHRTGEQPNEVKQRRTEEGADRPAAP